MKFLTWKLIHNRGSINVNNTPPPPLTTFTVTKVDSDWQVTLYNSASQALVHNAITWGALKVLVSGSHSPVPPLKIRSVGPSYFLLGNISAATPDMWFSPSSSSHSSLSTKLWGSLLHSNRSIPRRYCGFGSRQSQSNESHGVFGFPVHRKVTFTLYCSLLSMQ